MRHHRKRVFLAIIIALTIIFSLNLNAQEKAWYSMKTVILYQVYNNVEVIGDNSENFKNFIGLCFMCCSRDSSVRHYTQDLFLVWEKPKAYDIKTMEEYMDIYLDISFKILYSRPIKVKILKQGSCVRIVRGALVIFKEFLPQ